MSWTDHIDGYCERTDATLWSEPVNAVTNVSFVVAAILTWRMARAAGDRPAQVPVAILLLAAVLAREDRRTARAMVVIAAVFVVSLGLRTVDGRLCATLPLGTHFGWHVLNGVVAGAMIVLFISRGRVSPASSGSPRAGRRDGSPAPR